MTFKRGGVFVAMILVAVLLALYAILEFGANISLEDVLWLLAIYSVPISILLICCPSCERTVEMSAEGCTVRFLRYKKFYRWDELRVKRLADYRYCNWGWNGSSDGYFISSVFDVSSYAFNTNIQTICNIEPK